MAKAEQSYGRVVVALDASRANRAALESSAVLASAFGAELVGLFIEDVNQLRMGQLPFARLAGPGAVSHEIDDATLERLMRRAARDARDRLANLAAAGPVPVPWSFHVVRGVVARELKAAAKARDLVVVDDTSLPRPARANLANAGTSVLCMRSDGRGAQEVIVVYGTSGPQRRALAAAVRLAKASGRGLTILTADPKAAREYAQSLEPIDVAVQVAATSIDPAALAAATRDRPGAIMVCAGGEKPTQQDTDVEVLLADRRCSLFIVT